MKTRQLQNTLAIASLVVMTSTVALGQAAALQQPARKLVPAQSQVVDPFEQATKTSPPAGPSAPGTAPANESTPTSSADATETQIKAQRLAKIKQLKFDRRPSAILKAWSTPPKSPEQEEKEKKQQDGKKEPEKPATPPNPVTEAVKAFELELKGLQRNVTLGHWEPVGDFFASLKEDEGKAAYNQLLTTLTAPPTGVPSQLRRFAEQHVFTVDDVMHVISVNPGEVDKPLITKLSAILRMSVTSGNDIDHFIKQFHELAQQEEPKIDRLQTATLLLTAGHPVRAGEFLPEAEDAIREKDRDALNLLSRYYLALHAKEKKIEQLKQAWEVTQAALSAGEITDEQKAEALKRAVELAPKLDEELGQNWLDESFTSRPERGKEIIATIGSAVSTGLTSRPTIPDQRAAELELQRTAVAALVKASPERADEWAPILNLLARNWLREAEHARLYDTSTSRGPMLQRDIYGNYFYSGNRTVSRSGSTPQAIETGKLLDMKPEGRWQELIDPELQPKLSTILPQLYLKVNEEDTAFPYIERLAETNPEIAKSLAEEFLRVWTNNNDPNSSRRRTSIYMFSYGFNRRAQGIPLTRSKQDRNLKDLAQWLKRLRALPIDELDENLVTRAFTNTHGTAEVYRLETIESVFGSLGDLKPRTLSELIQRMRANLSGVWRMPATQKQAGTNRKKKDIEAEVRRGYEVARDVLDKALEVQPEHWALHLAKASIAHDENEYYNDLEQSSQYTDRRDAAMQGFRDAAALYAKAAPDLAEEDETAKVYETWFYASLGAVDINKLDETKQANLKEPPRIREAILSLPGEAAERHMAKFANSLFTRLSAVNAAVKFRFLKAGFQVVQDHERAHEARKVFDYYKDLVTEIKLETVIDGSDVVGHSEPFGVFVNLRHTKEIERESGGFSRYLQNQNNMYYSYNYGRPSENYRDKFEEMCIEALSEQFEVLSVTFQREDVNSKATDEYGWRVTPYAYVLLKPRGAEVDRLPPLQLDLDFLDTSGYAVIPVESAALPLDCRPENGEPRPIKNLQITQTLDERQADEGRLIVEVKASGLGLVPPLNQLVKTDFPDFDVKDVVDEGVSVSQFDKESADTAVVTERNILVTLEAKDAVKQQPTDFAFAEPLAEEANIEYQRYVDADLASVEQVVSLEQKYGEPQQTWHWWLLGGLSVVAAVAVSVILLLRKPTSVAAARRFELPEHVTPFTVLGLLKDIESNNGLNTDRQTQLAGTINRLEEYYFFAREGDEPDLSRIARDWVNQAR